LALGELLGHVVEAALEVASASRNKTDSTPLYTIGALMLGAGLVVGGGVRALLGPTPVGALPYVAGVAGIALIVGVSAIWWKQG
jgi:hypothetical protein